MVDSDCDGSPAANEVDGDGDGFAACEECDDSRASVYPGADEACNNIDDDCDGVTDEDASWYPDDDGDGYGDSGASAVLSGCNDPPQGHVDDATDCDDGNGSVYPGSVTEAVNDECMIDGDGDGFGDAYAASPYDTGTDCDDENPDINPEGQEVCDDSDIDEDCDGLVDDDDNSVTGKLDYYYDGDGDGYGDEAITEAYCDAPSSWVEDGSDCDDNDASIYPGALSTEVLFDNNCDGVVNELSASSYDAAITGNAEEYLTYDNALSITDVTGDGVHDLFIGSAYTGGLTFVNDGVEYANIPGGVHMLDGSDYASWDGPIGDYTDAQFLGDGALNYASLIATNQTDTNGDGTIDFLIGGTDAARDYADNGWSNIAAGWFSGVGSLSGEYYLSDADIIFYETLSNYGAARATAEFDVNGDGAKDVIFGDYLHGEYTSNGWINSQYCSYEGFCSSSAHIFSGAELAAGEYSIQSDANVSMDGENSWDYLGQTISGGDLDNDGDDELFVAAPGLDEVSNGEGCILIFNGGEEIFTDPNYQTDRNDIDFYLDYNNATICGETENSRLGWNAGVKLGDFNGDGDWDLVVSGPNANKVYVFYSAASLMGNGNYADTDADVVITAESGPGQFGYSLAVGDMNGDGIDDLAIGAPDLGDPITSIFDYTALRNSSNVPTQNGKVYLYSGSNLANTMTEEDADGVIVSSAPDAFGTTIVTTDMNGDGVYDLWVGAPFYDGDAGRATLYLMTAVP